MFKSNLNVILSSSGHTICTQSENLFHDDVNCHNAFEVWISLQGPILPDAYLGSCL